MAFLGIQRDAWEQSLVSPNCLRLQLDLVSDYALVWKLESPTKNEFERFSMDVAAGVCSFNELNAHWRNLRAVERGMMDFSALSISNMLASFPSTPRPDARRLEQLGSIFAASVASLFFSQVIFLWRRALGKVQWIKVHRWDDWNGFVQLVSVWIFVRLGHFLRRNHFSFDVSNISFVFFVGGGIIIVIIVICAQSLGEQGKRKRKRSRASGFERQVRRCSHAFALLRGLGVFVSTSFVAYERRHLMTWAILRPNLSSRFALSWCLNVSWSSVSFSHCIKNAAYESLSAQVRRERKRSS